ncbi:hypothetical protein BASA60_011301 [Batrachochytrium salamandrivorans]|nr:hypothetical protein BASA60_011301 [Batrachochytrium salamandrivorans]
MSGGVDTTELPPEYVNWKRSSVWVVKVDKIKSLYELLLKVSATTLCLPMTTNLLSNDKVLDFANTVSSGATLAGQQPPLGADLVHPEEPLAVALKKFGAAEERAGNMRIKQDQDAVSKFHNPLMEKLNVKIADAMKSRRNVHSVRLTYDACRSRLKTAPPERAEPLRTEMEKAEDEFVIAVDDSMGRMKLVIENSDLLRAVADLIAIQLQYHKSVYEVLAEVSPEIDELVVTNEALYTSAPQH